MSETYEDDTPQVKTYRARRRLKVGPNSYREPGELFPEGHLQFRIDSFVHVGRVREVMADLSEFEAALEQYVTDEDQKYGIRARAGLIPGVVLRGPHRTPGPEQPTKQVAAEHVEPSPTRVSGRPTLKAPPATKTVAKGAAPKGTGKRPPVKRVSRAAAKKQAAPKKVVVPPQEEITKSLLDD